MHPVNQDSKGITGSTQSGEPQAQLRWTHSRELCAVFHKNGCPDCKAWRDHYIDCTTDPLSLEYAQSESHNARDEALNLKLLEFCDLEWDTKEVRLEIDALNCEIEELEAETARVQQGQEMTQVVSKIWQTLGQLQHDLEIEGAHSGHGASNSRAGPSSVWYQLGKRLRQTPCSAPGPGPICSSSGSGGEHGTSVSEPSSHPLYKRLHQTYRLATSPAEPIYISSDSDGEHVPTPAPVVR